MNSTEIIGSKVKTYKEFLNEGMFDQGIRRSHTNEVRQEDDVNILSFEGLKDYICNHYDITNEIKNIRTYDFDDVKYKMCMVTYTSHNNYDEPYWIEFAHDYNDEIIHIFIPNFFSSTTFMKKYKGLFEIIKDKYNVENYHDNHHIRYSITDKKGNISNELFLDLLDTILDNINDKSSLLIHKK